MTMKLSGSNLLVSGTSSVLLPNAQICQQGSVMGPGGGGFTNISSYMETAILNGAINMLHNLVLLVNQCLPLVMVSNASFMLYWPLELHILLPTGCICGDYGYVGSTL